MTTIWVYLVTCRYSTRQHVSLAPKDEDIIGGHAADRGSGQYTLAIPSSAWPFDQPSTGAGHSQRLPQKAGAQTDPKLSWNSRRVQRWNRAISRESWPVQGNVRAGGILRGPSLLQLADENMPSAELCATQR